MESRRWLAVAAVSASLACGGSNGGGTDQGSSSSYTPGVFPAASQFAAQCQSPRSGTDPTTGGPFPDRQGSTTDENNWLRSWTNDLYLWYAEVPDLNPASYSSTADYFDLLKTSAITASGQPKDRFHFTYPTDQWVQLSQSGVSAGYGAQWVVVASRPPRQVVVAYTDPGTPAADAGIERGAQVLAVDGVDLVNAGDQASVDIINAGLFPDAAGASHTFSVLDLGSSSPRDVTMVSANVTETPVQNVGTIRAPGGSVGYILFNDHIATAESELVDAFDQLSSVGVTDLVLDIRYNGGGYLDIASEVAYMIAGPGPTTGQGFESTVFNDKHTVRDPVSGQVLAPLPFHATAVGFSAPEGTALPTLNLPRVFVLTSANTCSASESIINGLRGVGITVIQVGTTTCGKPYGFYPADNCGTTYFSIEFKGVNAQGFGDYPDGFSPANVGTDPATALPGCSVADDFTHSLGDPREARLAAALEYRISEGCPPVTSARTRGPIDWSAVDGVTPRSPWRENRILRH
jgi:carboxyl-terminal processing protease